MTKNGAVTTAKRRAGRNKESGLVTLSTGVEAHFTPVSISIITEAQAAVLDPPVPMWFNEDKGRDEPNPDHPDYASALEAADQERNLASIDAMIMFGIELVDGLPEDDRWLKKLKFRQKRGLSNVDLAEFDLEDEIELEFLFKKYIAVAAPDMTELMKLSGVREEDIAEAVRSFQGDEE